MEEKSIEEMMDESPEVKDDFPWKKPSKFYLFKRKVKHIIQKIIRGFSDSDLWDLDYHLSELILPRLKAFRNYNQAGHPSRLKDENEWNDILDKMIYSFEYVLRDYGIEDDDWNDSQEKKYKEYEEGMKLFIDFFSDLWD
tara:strand:+ start:107 stop:526 length:420 start_codon:yes stop_codon:yes gene_type:complete